MASDTSNTAIRSADIDWSLPLQDGEKIQHFLGYADTSFGDFCRKHKAFCRKFPIGWKIHTEGFLDWFYSGQD